MLDGFFLSRNTIKRMINDFKFDSTLSFYDWRIPILASGIYVTAVLSLQFYMKQHKAMKLTLITGVHNIVLSLLSLVMFCGLVYGAVDKANTWGWRTLFCDHNPAVGGMSMRAMLGFWCYIFYVSKCGECAHTVYHSVRYYELIDTMLLVFKKRQLTILHVWHHRFNTLICNAKCFQAWLFRFVGIGCMLGGHPHGLLWL